MSEQRTDAPASPTVIPGFEILAEISRDRLGVVHRASQPLFRREVALRLIPDSARGGQRDSNPFCRAAEAVARHPHPDLVTLHESGENEGQLYLASDLPPGPSLRQRLDKGPMPPGEAVPFIVATAKIVSHLHQHHAPHLGLTSAGIYIGPDGSPSIGDLGLAGLLHDHANSPFPGDPAYAAPEQIAMKKADARADVYALGRLLVECLTGKPPGTPIVALHGIPGALARIVKKATDPVIERRYVNADDLIDDLERYRRGETPPPGANAQVGEWIRSHVVLTTVAVAVPVVILLSMLGAWLMSDSGKATRKENEDLRQAIKLADEKANKATSDREDVIQDALKKAQDEKNKVHLVAAERDNFRKRVLAEEKQRRDAETLLKNEARERGIAEEKVRLAGKEVSDARLARMATTRQFVGLHVAQGNAIMEAGNLTEALAPLVQALAVARREKLPEDAHRLRIAALLSRCPRPLVAHSYARGDVKDVGFSLDGKRLFTVGADGVLTARNAETGAIIGKKMVHGAAVGQAVFSPDAKRVLTADVMGKIRMWKVEDGTPVFDPLELESAVSHLGFSGDGKTFVVVRQVRDGEATGADAVVRQASDGEAISASITAQLAPRPVSLSRDGSRLLICCTDRAARIIDVKSSKQIGPALDHGGEVSLATLSPDGKFALTAGDGSAKVFDIRTGKATLSVSHDSDVTPHLDGSGRLLLTAGKDGMVHVHDTLTGKLVGSTRSPSALRQAVLSPDGRLVLLAGNDGVARVLNVASGVPALPALSQGNPLQVAALSADATRALTFDGQAMRVWDLTAGEPLSPSGPVIEPGAVYNIAGTRMARMHGDGVRVYEVATGKAVGAEMKHKGDVKTVLFNDAGDRLLTVANPPGNATTQTWDVRVWDAATGKPVGEVMEHFRDVSLAAFAGSNRLLTVSLDKRVRLWDAASGKRVGEPMEHKEDITLAMLSPDGKTVASTDKGGTTLTWEADSGKKLGDNMPATTEARMMAFSGDGKLLVTGHDGWAYVWGVGDGKQLLKLELPSTVTSAAISADGKGLLLGSSDGSARLWDIESGKARTPPLSHLDPVQRVAFSENGRWLLTASGRWVRLWDAATGEAVGPPLPHAVSDRAVTQLSLSKAGDLTTQAGPGSRWTRRLVGSTQGVDALAELALVISGREETGAGIYSPASPAAIEKVWSKRKEAGDFSISEQRQLAWARRGVGECEERGLWGGAAQHLEVLLASSSDPALFARRGKARAELGRNEEALADYNKALDSNPDRSDWLAGRGAVALALKQWERAAADFSQAVKVDDSRELWLYLGRAEAERGRWKEAASALTRAARLENRYEAVYGEPLAKLSSGDEKGYRQLCVRLLKRFSDRDGAPGRALADACVLAPGAVSDYATLLTRAERAARSDPDDVAEQTRYAALLLRSGDPAKAAAVLEKVADRAGPGELWLLALAQWRAGQKDKAKGWATKATEAKARADADWMERQRAALWRKEAEAAMK